MVEHKTWGSVRWLEPVDVRSLQLKDLVKISKNCVEVSKDWLSVDCKFPFSSSLVPAYRAGKHAPSRVQIMPECRPRQ